MNKVKKILTLVIMAVIFFGCSKETAVPKKVIIATVSPLLAKEKYHDEIVSLKEMQYKDLQKKRAAAEAKAEADAKLLAEKKIAETQKNQTVSKGTNTTTTHNNSGTSTNNAQSSTTTVIKTKPQVPNNHPVEYWTSVENEIASLCNTERAKVGVGPLSNNESLRTIARFKTNDMLQNEYFDHISPSGVSPSDLAGTFGYDYSTFGENIWMTGTNSLKDHPELLDMFKANVTAQKIVTAWMNSPGHRANILNVKFNKIGVGVSFSTYGRAYATQEFSN